jgi:hypothetical protein
MTSTRRMWFANATVQRILLLVASIAWFHGGTLRADTIILKSGAVTLPVEASIVAIDANEVIYIPTGGDRQRRKPVDALLQIKSADEPRLSAAEQAYADGKWADAVTGYQAAITASTADWAKYRATVRLIDAAARDKQYAPQVAGFIELAKRDPANAAPHRPGFTGVKADQIGAAIEAVDPALKSPGLKKESADVLRQFLSDLNLAKQDAAHGGGVTGNPATAPDAPTGGAIGPHGPEFASDATPSHQIIFLCDGSASMGRKSATLKDELRKAVSSLKPIHAFNIIFFQADGCSALDKTRPVGADREGKRNAFKFLDDATFGGTTDPIPGLTLAFQQHPHLLYLLTDGKFRDSKAVKDKIAELNKDHKVKVNTIAFVGKDDTDTDFLLTLQEIAKDNGGMFKHVTEEGLQK